MLSIIMKRIGKRLFAIACTFMSAASLFAQYDEPDEASFGERILYSLIGGCVVFFVCKYFFDRKHSDIFVQSNDGINSTWLLALPVFHLYGFSMAFSALFSPAARGVLEIYQNSPLMVIMLLATVILALVVGIVAIYTIYRIFKHKTKVFDGAQNLMLYSTTSLSICFLFFAYQFYHFNDDLRFLGGGSEDLSFVTIFLIFIVVVAWLLQRQYDTASLALMHDKRMAISIRSLFSSLNNSSSAYASSSQSYAGRGESQGTKQCPYCGETIMAMAKKCKHCGEWIKEEDEPKQLFQCATCGEQVEGMQEVCPHCKERFFPAHNAKVAAGQPSSPAPLPKRESNKFFVILAWVVGIIVLLVVLVVLVARCDDGDFRGHSAETSVMTDSAVCDSAVCDTVAYRYDSYYADSIAADSVMW